MEQALREVRDATSCDADETDPAAQQQQRIDALKKRVERQSGVLHRENIARLQTLSALFSAEMEHGSVRATCEHGEHMLEFYRRVYTANHPMTGLHLFTLGDLYDQLAQAGPETADWCEAKSIERLTEAQRILRITYGQEHRFVKMLADRLEEHHRSRDKVQAQG